MSESADSAVFVNTTPVFEAVAALRAATAWSGSYVNVPGGGIAPHLGNAAAEQALQRAMYLIRNLPPTYGAHLTTAADQILQGAIDTQLVDEQAVFDIA